MSVGLYILALVLIESTITHGSPANPDTNINDFSDDHDETKYTGKGGRNKRFVVFSGLQPAGAEVLDQVNQIMSNASISADSKRKLDATLSILGRIIEMGIRIFVVSYKETVYNIHTTRPPCPKDKEVCCRGYVAYKRCCTNISEMKRLLDLFNNHRAEFDNLRHFLITQGHNPDAGCPMSCGP